MNRSAFLNLIVLGLVLSVAAVGCKKGRTGVIPIPPATTPIEGGQTPSGPQRPPTPTPETGGPSIPTDTTPTPKPLGPDDTVPLGEREIIENMLADREVFKEQTVYFDFDRAEVKTNERSKVEAVATYLKSETANKLLVEGHCDERGTEEYNRALGERRALAVREYLISLGIAADRIFTKSWGEDKPAVDGHDETAWARNRRAEFILLKPKP